jgi:amidase
LTFRLVSRFRHSFSPILTPSYRTNNLKGSSSGSGIAAGIGLSFAALGTETRGSILELASRSNDVGIKPSVGLTSRHLVVPITEFQDTVGPLARSVLDAAALLSVMAGVDEYDNATSLIPNGGKIPDYVKSATRYANLSGIRIGIPRNGFSADLLYQQVNETAILASFDQAVSVLESLGAEIVD